VLKQSVAEGTGYVPEQKVKLVLTVSRGKRPVSNLSSDNSTGNVSGSSSNVGRGSANSNSASNSTGNSNSASNVSGNNSTSNNNTNKKPKRDNFDGVIP
jgi:hypothetical protein